MKVRLLTAIATLAMILFGPATMAAAAADDLHWQLDFLHAAQANAITEGDGVTIALIDSGVDGTHPDLIGTLVAGLDFDTGSGTGNIDLDGHGTSMASLIVGHGRVVGIAPKAKIMPLATNNDNTLPAAIDWAVDHGAAVINLSLAASNTPPLKAAIDRALAAGVVVVASAGNIPKDQSFAYPAAYEGVIAAGAVDQSGQHAALSMTGPALVLAAPGVDIEAATPFGEYSPTEGTSGSAALIAGVAALVKAKFPNLKGPDIYHRLVATADDKGAPGRDPEYGYGIVNPVKALTADVAPVTATPAPSSDIGAEQTTQANQGLPLGFTVVGGAALVIIALVIAVVMTTRRTR